MRDTDNARAVGQVHGNDEVAWRLLGRGLRFLRKEICVDKFVDLVGPEEPAQHPSWSLSSLSCM